MHQDGADAKLVVYDEAQITPFWQRLPRFFLFPLQPGMLLVLVALALASLLAPVIPVPRPLDLLLTEGLIWLAALRHAFTVMERTSSGLLTSAEQAQALPQPERVNLPWKLLGIVFAWGILLGAFEKVSPGLVLVGNLFFTVAFPASVMALSATNSLLRAANPLLWLSVMSQVGKAYWALFVFLLLLSSGAGIVIPILRPLLGGWLTLPLLNLVFMYFNLVMFNMMGYVLYQYHRELGVEVVVDFAATAARRGDATKDPVADAVAAKVAVGDLEGALDAAYEQQRTESDNIAVQERYQKLLLLAGKQERALDHGQRYLATLLRLGKDDLAFELFRRLRDLDTAFAPEPHQVLPLAQAAFRRRESAVALDLVRGFDRRHPRHADVPPIYLLSARLLSEQLRKDEPARVLLRTLCRKYPDHPLAAEAAIYLKVLGDQPMAAG